MQKLIVLSIVCLAVLGASFATSTAQAKTKWHHKEAKKCPSIVRGVEFYKQATWKWEDEFEIRHTQASIHSIGSCKYGTWVARLWRKRAWQLRDQYRDYERANRDFTRSASIAHRIFPDISVQRLWDRADAEGGHGGWVWNSHGSGAGGWFQFMEGTYYGRSDEAFSAARRRGFPIPAKFDSFYSMLGQNITAAYMFSIGLECSGEGWAASC